MSSDSQLSAKRLKHVLPYPFSKKSHRVMWAIGALVLFLTVPFLNAESSKNVAAPNNVDETAQPKNKQPNEVAVPAQSYSSTIRINNEVIPVPENGSVHKTIQSSDGPTQLKASIDASSSSDQSHSSTNIHLNVTSHEEITIENSE